MQTGLSFVVPVLNEEANIATVLQDLRQRYPQAQILVVDGGSTDCTVALALPLCDQLLLCERGRARQMNLGAQVATAPYIFFLHADSRPSVSASELQAYLVDGPEGAFAGCASVETLLHFVLSSGL